MVDKVTSVVAVCFDENEKVVLMGNEPIGGHVESGESVEAALKRESLEEGGIELIKWKYFGYYEVKLSDTASEEYKSTYPKVGYILFFLAKGRRIMEPYGTDVKNTQVLDKDYVLNSGKFPHEMLLEGLKLHPLYLD
ncbi:NUDIX domain-containing protein [Patescibacteria group bacterium]|nr:NUDIX domain-containing protein [Patescibacteria group bacterium]